jgi:hypothetical protein
LQQALLVAQLLGEVLATWINAKEALRGAADLASEEAGLGNDAPRSPDLRLPAP